MKEAALIFYTHPPLFALLISDRSVVTGVAGSLSLILLLADDFIHFSIKQKMEQKQNISTDVGQFSSTFYDP